MTKRAKTEQDRSNKDVKAEARKRYRNEFPRHRHSRHSYRGGLSGSLRDATVYIWECGFVVAFNSDKQQIYEIQGPYYKMRASVITRYHRNTKIFTCKNWFTGEKVPITIEDFRHWECVT